MIELRERDTGNVITENDLRKLAGSISLPAVLGQYEFDRFRVDPVLHSPQPQCTQFQYVVRDGVVGDGTGRWFQAWRIVDMTAGEIAVKTQQLALASREGLKAIRTAAVAGIKVTVNGKTFDGDEQSQSRMARAILVSQITGLTETTWTLADNTEATVTIDDLKNAMAQAGLRQSQLWNLDQYET